MSLQSRSLIVFYEYLFHHNETIHHHQYSSFLTNIKSAKNSFSVKSGGLKNYKLLIGKPLLTCSFSQETCLTFCYYQKEKLPNLTLLMVVKKLRLTFMLVRKLLLLMTS